VLYYLGRYLQDNVETLSFLRLLDSISFRAIAGAITALLFTILFGDRIILALYRRLIGLRRDSPALSLGSYHPVTVEGDVFAYERRHGGEAMLIALNLGHGSGHRVVLPGRDRTGRVLLSTHSDRHGETVAGAITLRPDEGVVVSLRA